MNSKEYRKKYYEKNKEKLKAYQRMYYRRKKGKTNEVPKKEEKKFNKKGFLVRYYGTFTLHFD